MTAHRGFCPRCGEDVTVDSTDPSASDADPSPPQINESVLCETCYFDQFELVGAPDRIEVTVCTSCGAVLRGQQWVDVEADDYTDIAIAEVQKSLQVHVDAQDVRWDVATEQVGPNTVRAHATVTGVVKGTTRTETTTVPVRISRGTCTRCGRIAGDYYASTVQVRADDRLPTAVETTEAVDIATAVVADMVETGDREAFITEVSSVDGGINIRVSTAKIGEKIARQLTDVFGGSVTASETLVTEDRDGNQVYRVAYSVRLPKFTPGDVIDPRDGEGPVLVKSVHDRLKGLRLASGSSYEASVRSDELDEARKLGSETDADESTLVTVEDDYAVQVLDPDTYQAKSIPRPSYLDAEATSVRVIKSNAGLHILPDD